MNLREYFHNASGHGILATADANGLVDVAIYASPHIMDDNTIAFIMADRLTHHNLQTNPHAAYLFLESGEKLAGKRMFLTKVKEEKDSDLLYAIRRKNHGRNDTARYLVFFRVDTILPLVGSRDETEQ